MATKVTWGLRSTVSHCPALKPVLSHSPDFPQDQKHTLSEIHDRPNHAEVLRGGQKTAVSHTYEACVANVLADTESLIMSDPVLNVLVFSPLLTLNKSRETKPLFEVPHWSRSFLEVESLGIQETGVRRHSLVVDFLVTPTQVSPLSQAVVNNDN